MGSLAATLLLGLALSAPPAPPAAPRGVRPAPAASCLKLRPQVERNELVGEAEVAGWASAALDKAALLDERSACFLHVRITAGPTRTGGREDGWLAHVALSTRRYQKDGKLVTNERGTLLVEPRREEVVARARAFLEDYVSRLRAPPAGGAGDAGGGPDLGDRG